MIRCENSFFDDTWFHFRTNPYFETTATFKLMLRFETYLGFEATYINVNFKTFTHLRITCHDDTDRGTWQWYCTAIRGSSGHVIRTYLL